MHVGIVSSSLGGRGGDQCDPNAPNPANTMLNAHYDDRAHLIVRWGPDEVPTMDALPTGNGGNFLAWAPFPTARADVNPLGQDPGTAPGGDASMGTLVGDFTGMVQGVHDHGCGFVGANEAFYRFLMQPDPYESIQRYGQMAQLSGIDATILQERADFLRPDSLVVIVVVTQKSESLADPLALGGQGWTFANSTFPGSPNLAAPEGTIECKEPVDPNNPTSTGPYGPRCTSCAFIQGDPDFATRCPDDGNGTGGFLDPTDDALNLRFFHQKLRFGVSVEYPTSRYVRGLRMPTVPDSAHEHDHAGSYAGDLQANCVNPLYAAALPTDPSGELCALSRGQRTPDMVFYATIAGVPHQLLREDPANPDSPPKDILSDADWTRITGADPEHYDFTGADFHMIESSLPRTADNLPPGVENASQCPPGSADDCDPINGREIDTFKGGLQFACIFSLQAPKDCAAPSSIGACDCEMGARDSMSPLCQQVSGAYTSTQIASRAYPAVREMIIARALGDQGIVSSLCPIHTLPANGDDPPDPLFGYRPAMNTLVNRIKPAFAEPCVQPLAADPEGRVPCQVLVVVPGAGGSCTNPDCDGSEGLSTPAADVRSAFCSAKESAWRSSGGVASGLPDPATQSVCELKQLTVASDPGAFDSTGSCAAPTDGSLGWCYAAGPAAGICSQAIVFTNDEPPTGAAVYLRCM